MGPYPFSLCPTSPDHFLTILSISSASSLFHSYRFFFPSLPFLHTSSIRTQLLLRSPFPRSFVFVLYARSDEFQICSRGSWGVEIGLSIKAPVIHNKYPEGFMGINICLQTGGILVNDGRGNLRITLIGLA